MDQLNRTKVETLVLRLWQEGDCHGQHTWRGSLTHPKTERQVGFQSLEMLAKKIVDLLGEVKSDGNGEKKD